MEPIQLKRREFGSPELGPHLLITGGVHGDEFEPMAAIRRLGHVLDGAEIPGRVTLVPVVNEAAFRLGTRCAEDGLDLARTCPGKVDGSLTERTAFALAELIRTADYYIDLHTGGTRLSAYPMTGYVLHPDQTVLERQRQMAQAFNLPMIWGTDYRPNGRSLSVARDAHVPAIYAEYHGAAVCNPDGLDAYVEGCLNVMVWLGLWQRPPVTSQVQHIVEDARPDSGHMQVCNPAPMDGFFEPAVTLGQTVRAGDLLGTVCDILGDDVRKIEAQESGIVLVLRTFSSVQQGDALAVVAATEKSP